MSFYKRIKMSKSEILATVLPRLAPGNNPDKYSEYARVSFLDMTVLFYLPFLKDNDLFTTILIPDRIVKEYDITITELFDAACKNMEQEITVDSMDSIMEELTGVPIKDLCGQSPLLVVCNKERFLGAASILNNRILYKIQKKVGDFVVLPSSIHEVIIVPYDSDVDVQDLVYMVHSVNETEVLPEDKLSDNIYIWKNGRFTVVS